VTTTARIQIPSEMRPRDGRFGSGPSKVRNDAVRALSDAAPGYMGTSHRRDGVRSVVRRIREGVAELFALPDGYEVLLGLGGSTLFWDAASFGLIERRASHLVIGEFSAKFAAVTRAAPHLEEPQIRETGPGAVPGLIDDVEGDAYAYPHNETSTGVTVPVHRPARGNALVLVDATSAAGGLRVDARMFDAYYFAPQKCFASDAGLWLACCSPAAIERIERLHASGRWVPASLDLKIALDNSRRVSTRRTTRPRSRRCSCSTASSHGCSGTAGSSSPRAAATRRPPRCTAGRTRIRTPRRSSPTSGPAAT
jgi:phosphoserine aminotransferase